MTARAKQAKPADLSEYAEEAVPFDTVIRKILTAKPMHRVATKPKRAKTARKRK